MASSSMCSLRFPSRAASAISSSRTCADHPIALADDRLPDGLGQVAFAGAGWAIAARGDHILSIWLSTTFTPLKLQLRLTGTHLERGIFSSSPIL